MFRSTSLTGSVADRSLLIARLRSDLDAVGAR